MLVLNVSKDRKSYIIKQWQIKILPSQSFITTTIFLNKQNYTAKQTECNSKNHRFRTNNSK